MRGGGLNNNRSMSRQKQLYEILRTLQKGEIGTDLAHLQILRLFGVSDLFCRDCGAETSYDNDLGRYKCNECEWEG